MKSFKPLLIPILCFCKVNAQVLTPENAVEIALKNNIELIVSKNNYEISSISYSRGNAGMLPNIQFLTGSNFSQNDTKQNLLNGTVVDRKGAVSTGINSSVVLNWTLFDGMKMFASYKKLNSEKNLNENILKQETEKIVSQVLIQYYTLVKTKQLIKSFNQALDLYISRQQISEAKWKNGAVSKIIYLQAQIDLNEQQSILMNLKNEEESLKINLNELLARSPETQFEVIDSILIAYSPKLEALKSNYKKNNFSIKAQEIKKEIGNLKLKEIRSQFFPKVTMNTGYNFTRNENQAGFILLNRNLGLNAGITAGWTLFNSGNTTRLMKSTKIENSNADLIFNALQIGIESEILKNFISMYNSLEILKLEEKNLSLAQENAETALESFRLGALTLIEVKEAQKSYQDAIQRTINLRLQIKKNEIELLKLNGELIKQ